VNNRNDLKEKSERRC